MALERCTDLSAVDWVVRSGTPWWQLLTFGPDVFEASARLRLIPDPTAPDQRESQVVVPEGYPGERDQSRDVLRALAGFTTTPDRVCFAVWLGDGMSDHLSRGPGFDLPERDGCALFVGDVRALETDTFLARDGILPAMVWPDDRSWVLACDVDPHWAGIGGSVAAIGAVLGDTRLDAVPADPRAEQPGYHGPLLGGRDQATETNLPPGRHPGVYREPGLYRP